jgi:predicted dehydrogenase
MSSVLLVGLGAIGETHARALEATASADVVAGVDVDGSRVLTFRGADRPIYPSLREASEVLELREPDLVVIATPTGTHAAVCEQAARWFPQARLLVEKPAAATLGDARRLLSGIGGRPPVEVAYHTSFAPEVEWGQRVLAARRCDRSAPSASRSSRRASPAMTAAPRTWAGPPRRCW